MNILVANEVSGDNELTSVGWVHSAAWVVHKAASGKFGGAKVNPKSAAIGKVAVDILAGPRDGDTDKRAKQRF